MVQRYMVFRVNNRLLLSKCYGFFSTFHFMQRYMVSRVNNNVDMAPVGRVTLVQQLQNCMPLATGTGEHAAAGRALPHLRCCIACAMPNALL